MLIKEVLIEIYNHQKEERRMEIIWQGVQAHQSGEAIYKNPYQDRDFRKMWDFGWREAQRGYSLKYDPYVPEDELDDVA